MQKVICLGFLTGPEAAVQAQETVTLDHGTGVLREAELGHGRARSRREVHAACKVMSIRGELLYWGVRSRTRAGARFMLRARL